MKKILSKVERDNWHAAPYNYVTLANPTLFTNVRIMEVDKLKARAWDVDLQKELLEKKVKNEKNEKMTFNEWFDRSKTNGFIIAKEGKVIAEKYSENLNPNKVHFHASVTKSMTSLVAMELNERKVIDFSKKVCDYLPDFKGTAYSEYTLQRLMDMQVPVRFSEDYTDPKADIWSYAFAMGILKEPENYEGPKDIREYCKNITPIETKNPTQFRYITPNIDTIAIIISEVTGKSLGEIFNEMIFSKLYPENDGMWIVDKSLGETAGSGFLVTARDALRICQLILNKGEYNGKQILNKKIFEKMPEHALKNLPNFKGSLPDSNPDRQGWSYHNQFWFTNWENGVYCAIGIYGNIYYINPKEKVIVVKLTAHPTANQGELNYQVNMIDQLVKQID